jgi:hypothetical protein
MVLIIIIFGCTPRQKYEIMVRKGLASGIRYDSLFLGLNLGMTGEEFYKKCWDLNKQGLVMQGTGNLTVEYVMDDFDHEVEMNFYPNFKDDKIYEMPVQYNYTGWSPWTKHMFADSLQLRILKKYEEWYGPGFIKVDHSFYGSAYTKVDGNRRITIYKKDDQYVGAIFTDLIIEKQLKESGEIK